MPITWARGGRVTAGLCGLPPTGCRPVADRQDVRFGSVGGQQVGARVLAARYDGENMRAVMCGVGAVCGGDT